MVKKNTPMVSPDSPDKMLFGTVKLGEKGQIVIPKEARERYGLKAGDTLMVMGDGNGIAMLKNEVFMEIINAYMSGLMPKTGEDK